MERKKSDPDRENQSNKDRQRDTEQESSWSTAEAEPVASLHQVVGNQAVQRLHEGGVLQANLSVSQPDDPAERESERVAEQVMNAAVEQRGTASATGEEPPGGGRDGSTPHAVTPIEDRTPEIDESPRSGGAGQQAGEDVERALESSSGGKPLPPAARSFFEPRFGRDFGDVRVHSGGEAADLNRQLDAKALTHGSDIYFDEGEYRPGSSDGKHLMAHELTHVVQQTGDSGKSVPRTHSNRIQRDPNGNGEEYWRVGRFGDTYSSEYEYWTKEYETIEKMFAWWTFYSRTNWVGLNFPPKQEFKDEVKRRLEYKKESHCLYWLKKDSAVNDEKYGRWLRKVIRKKMDDWSAEYDTWRRKQHGEIKDNMGTVELEMMGGQLEADDRIEERANQKAKIMKDVLSVGLSILVPGVGGAISPVASGFISSSTSRAMLQAGVHTAAEKGGHKMIESNIKGQVSKQGHFRFIEALRKGYVGAMKGKKEGGKGKGKKERGKGIGIENRIAQSLDNPAELSNPQLLEIREYWAELASMGSTWWMNHFENEWYRYKDQVLDIGKKREIPGAEETKISGGAAPTRTEQGLAWARKNGKKYLVRIQLGLLPTPVYMTFVDKIFRDEAIKEAEREGYTPIPIYDWNEIIRMPDSPPDNVSQESI